MRGAGRCGGSFGAMNSAKHKREPADAETSESRPPPIVRTCSICGRKLPAGNPAASCPVCLLRIALDPGYSGDGIMNEGDLAESGIGAAEANPRKFGHYEIQTHPDGSLRELGHGAMGITFKAIDVNLRIPVTLKVLNLRLFQEELARRRFFREARSAATVHHPNVASVYYLGSRGREIFYAMEFVEGETLENLIKRSGRLEIKLALEIATQVAAGLAAVHKQNLVHRDIKPSNIMVSLEGEGTGTVKIIDLGLAKAAAESHSEAAISMPGVFAGTPEFASPEQFAGVGVDIRSDLYSLGVTLWEMLTGQVPFRGSPAEVMHQHQHAPLPVEQLKDVPQPLVVLLEVLLEKDVTHRCQTPAELLKVMPTVRDAMDSGRLILKTIRVFVSSTGDVQKERNVAERGMRSIAGEFNLPVSTSYSNFQRLAEESGAPETDPENHGALVLCPCFWGYQRVGSDAGYKGQIPITAEFDLVICILWSRLGNPFAPTLKIPDGSPPNSGTEYEIAWALDHARKNRGVSSLHVYRNCSKPTPPL